MAFCRSLISQEVLFQKIFSSNYPQQRAAQGLHCDRSKHSTLTHAGVSQERPQQGTVNTLLCSQQNPSNSRGETVSSQSIYPRKKTVCPTENIIFLPHKWNKTTVHVPPSGIMTFLCQQKRTWPSNCTAGYSRLIIQRAQPTRWYYIGHFLKNHILLTIHWEVHCSSLDF